MQFYIKQYRGVVSALVLETSRYGFQCFLKTSLALRLA